MPREWLIQHRAGTLAEWAAAEASGPVLLAGERAYITDLKLDVVGDGVTKVASLGAVGSGTYAPIAQVAPGVKLYNPAGLIRWSTALSDAVVGAASLAVFGDSVSVGIGADGSSSSTPDTTARSAGWVGQLRSLFAQQYGDPGEGFIGSPQVDGGSRMSVSGGGAFYVPAGPMGSGARALSSGQIITTTLPACTEIDIYTWHGGGTGTYQIDGGSVVDLPTGSADGTGTTWDKTTVTGLANTTHTVVVGYKSVTGANGCYLAGITARKQATGVQVHRLAKSGAVTGNLTGNDLDSTGNPSRQARLAAAAALVPTKNLAVIALGVNNFGNQNNTAESLAQPGSTPTTYAAHLTTIAQAVAAAGGCTLLLGEPRQNSANYPSPMTYAEADYYAAAAAVALAQPHTAFLDIAEMFGTNVQGQASGLYTTSSVHPTRAGHGVIARAVHRALTMPLGPGAPTT